MRRILPYVCLLMLCGCASSMEQLRKLDPQANDFYSSLASEYLAYAESEKEQGREARAEYFAGKGVRALRGGADPENVSGVDSPLQKQLNQSRRRLMVLMTDDVKKVASQKLARAQLLFDCWVEQSAQPGEEIAPCGSEFESTIEDLQLVAESFIQGQETIQYIKFSGKNAVISDQYMQTIGELAAKIGNMPMYSVTLDANPSGNWTASRRLTLVKRALVDAGVPERRIKVRGKPAPKAVYIAGEEPEEHRDTVKITARDYGAEDVK